MGFATHALTVLVLCAALAGCAYGEVRDPSHAGTPAEAEKIAVDWLAAVSGSQEDRGWSLLHPLTQERIYGRSQEAYLSEVGAIDWSGFEWEIARRPIWDGNWLLTVDLPGETDAVVLLADGHLAQPIKQGESAGAPQAAITVRIDSDGTEGVLGP
jgi:hypothetical protein